MKVLLAFLAGALIVVMLGLGIFVAATWAPERSVEDLKARWATPPSAFIDVMGLNVHVRDEGPRDDPSPIVLMHGTGSSLHAWQGWAEALRDKRRVISFDLAGYGLTGPWPDQIYGAERDIQLTLALLDRLGVKRAVLGGNSLGGGIALRTALAHPDRVDKLILVDAGGYPFQSPSLPLGMHLLRAPGVGWLLQHTLPRFLVVQGLHKAFGDPGKVTAEMVDRAAELTQREGNRRAIVERTSQRSTISLAPRIPEIKMPTLIMWGGRDNLIPVSVAHRFHQDIAGSTLAIFDDLGHAPEEEDPARTAEAVKRFLGL